MKVRKIKIINFRNLKDLVVYPQKTTVIVGENNAGKSNFIHALRLILDVQAERLRFDLSEADINDVSRKNGQDFFEISMEIGDLQAHVEIEAVFKERLDIDPITKETFVTIQGRYEKDADGFFVFNLNLLQPSNRNNTPMKITTRMSKAVPLYFLEALRDAQRDTRSTGRSLLAQMLSEIDFSDVQVDVQDGLRNANSALGRGAQVSNLTDGITNQLSPLAPGGQGFVKLTVSDENPLDIRRNFRLSYQKSIAHIPSDISRFGTGLQNLLLVAIFRHKIKNIAVGVPILAIEEPEAHLHPHAQRRLYKDLNETNTPVFITTHSPSIVKYANPMSLILFRSIDDITYSYQLNADQLTRLDLSNLEQLMRGGRAELFFARSIIIVEGQSELFVLPAFAELLGCDLDRDGISLVESGNNNFSYILNSCKPANFSIPSVVVYDTDELGSSNGLVKEACKAGLVSVERRNSIEASDEVKRSSLRKSALDEIGWLGVDNCLEDVVCKEGYMEVVLEIVKNNDQENHSDFKALETFLKGQDVTPELLSEFINKKRETLKTPVALGVAEAVHRIKRIPSVYENAIRKAVLLSQQGLLVDDMFESRSWSVGFKNLITDFLVDKGLEDKFIKYCESFSPDMPLPIKLSGFVKGEDFSVDLRNELRIKIALAVEACGCIEYADNIRAVKFAEAI